VFLIGIGLGSGVGSALAPTDPVRAVRSAWAQLALIAAIAWASWNITAPCPTGLSIRALASSPWIQFQIDFVPLLWAILPAACLWGASFPWRSPRSASRGADGGVVVGRIYAANTMGAIVGALGTSLVLIVAVGTQNSERILIAISAVAAALTLIPALLNPIGQRRVSVCGTQSGPWPLSNLPSCLGRNVVAVPPLLVGPAAFPRPNGNTKETFPLRWRRDEFVPGGLARLERNPELLQCGKIQASTLPQDMRLQRMLGHLTTLIPANPREVLVDRVRRRGNRGRGQHRVRASSV